MVKMPILNIQFHLLKLLNIPIKVYIILYKWNNENKSITRKKIELQAMKMARGNAKVGQLRKQTKQSDAQGIRKRDCWNIKNSRSKKSREMEIKRRLNKKDKSSEENEKHRNSGSMDIH